MRGYPSLFVAYRGSAVPLSSAAASLRTGVKDAAGLEAAVGRIVRAARSLGDDLGDSLGDSLGDNLAATPAASAAAATTSGTAPAAGIVTTGAALSLALSRAAAGAAGKGHEAAYLVLHVVPAGDVVVPARGCGGGSRGGAACAERRAFEALAVRLAAVTPSDLGLPAATAPTGQAASPSSPSFELEFEFDVARCLVVAADALGPLLLGGGDGGGAGVLPAGLPQGVAAAGKAALAVVRVPAAATAATATGQPTATVSHPGLLSDPLEAFQGLEGLGGGGSGGQASGGASQGEAHAGPELGSARALGFFKAAVRPGVVAFGRNGPFDALMQSPHVLQLLVFDRFPEVHPSLGATRWGRAGSMHTPSSRSPRGATAGFERMESSTLS